MPSKLLIPGASRKDHFAVPPDAPKGKTPGVLIKGWDDDDVDHPTAGKVQIRRLKDFIADKVAFGEMVRSLDEMGQLQTVVACQDDKGNLLLEAGRCRTVAMRALNELRKKEGRAPMMLSVVLKGDSDDVDKLIGVKLHENEIRSDLSTLAKAQAAHELIENQGWSVEQVGKKFGRSEQTIKSWLPLVKASPAVKAALESGDIKPTAAAGLARLPKEKQEEKLKEAKAKGKGKGKVSVRAVRKATSKNSQYDKPPPKTVRRLADDDRCPVDARELAKWFLGEGPEPDWVTEILETEAKDAAAA